MAVRVADQTAFLGIGLRHRFNDAHAARWRLSPRRRHGEPYAPVQRDGGNGAAVSARTQSRWYFAHRGTFHFRVSLRVDALGPGAHIDRTHIPQPGRSRGNFGWTLMKGLAPLFLGIFGTFAFSWVGLTVIPNWQIGHLNPQSDEEGTDIYPQPQSGMVTRGARVYAANGCIYCHSQQVRADYAADDIERKWGERRSAPRDYIFEQPVFLGKMRMGQDITNIGARAPAEQENAPPGGAASPAASPAPQGGAPAPSVAPSAAAAAGSPAKAGSPSPGAPPPKGSASPSPAG